MKTTLVLRETYLSLSEMMNKTFLLEVFINVCLIFFIFYPYNVFNVMHPFILFVLLYALNNSTPKQKINQRQNSQFCPAPS